MKDRNIEKWKSRERRRRRTRKRISGTPEVPRLAVCRSLKHIYAQLIDDENGKALLAISSHSPEIRRKRGELKGKCAVAKEVGLLVAERAKKVSISRVVFDRSCSLYHGRVKAVAEGAREGGLKF
jgi:large subunit ribosomal protein L18